VRAASGSLRDALSLLDTAIAELRSQLDQNRFNTHLRKELLAVYQEKQHTLEQVVRANLWVGLVALVGAAAIIGAQTLSLRALLPANSIFHRVEGHDLTLGGESCRKERDLSFVCGSGVIRADAVSGQWGVHRCMTAPDSGELRIRARMVLGSFLAGDYDPTPDREGTIRLSVDGLEIGAMTTRPAFLWHQFIQFDTRQFRDREATVELTLTGAALHCFDFRIVR